MNDDPTIHYRKTIRLKGYDYSQPGGYFVTIVTQGRECLFGKIKNGAMVLNRYGLIVHRAWLDLPHHYLQIKLGAFCIMPNHVHGIIIIEGDGVEAGLHNGQGDHVGAGLHNGYGDHVGAGLHNGQGSQVKKSPGRTTNPGCPSRPAPTQQTPLSEIVRAFKSFSARRINVIRKMAGYPVWQRNYYEHIIRNEGEYKRIQYYIENNPAQWNSDGENVNR